MTARKIHVVNSTLGHLFAPPATDDFRHTKKVAPFDAVAIRGPYFAAKELFFEFRRDFSMRLANCGLFGNVLILCSTES